MLEGEEGVRGKLCQELGMSRNQHVNYHLRCLFVFQIEYFNQRRVIAEAQKDRLARVNEQSQSSKK